MPTVYGKNLNDLEKFMERQLLGWMQKIAIKLPEYLEEFIRSEYYDQYTPEMYERQYRIIEAITVTSIKKTSAGYELSIYLDPSKVSYDPSFWYDKTLGSWGYIKGGTSEEVFKLISQGIHGWKENSQTDGRFWETFLKSVDAGGIYDLFEDFKRHLNKTGKLKLN